MSFHGVCEFRRMARPLRRDYPGAIHHVFVRGNARSAVAVDAVDHQRMLALLEQATSRFELVCHAWCLLPNHAHFMLTSQLGNLSRAMHWLGTCAAQSFNRRHERSGHLFQGRFGSKLVEDDGYFLELARYLPLNPVRAGLCRSPDGWLWSSYGATAGLRPTPSFLDAEAFIGLLGSRDAYITWVAQGVDASIIDEHGFRQPPPRTPLAILLADGSDHAISCAHSDGYSHSAIAEHLGMTRRQISCRLAAQLGV
jgi:REP element-mobilizing transposase RayT